MTTQGNKCPICLKLFNDPRWMPCKHIYCFKCIPTLHRRDFDTKNEIVLECRICAMRHNFRDWSTVKYYATLNCVPYLTALQFDNTSILSTKSSCSTCFNGIIDHLEYCIHCNKTICHDCLINHRMEMKKNILHVINQCRLLITKNQQNTQQIMNKLDNLKTHVDFCAFEFTDQVDAYYDFILAQIDEEKFSKEANSSSGYESITEQQLSDLDYEIDQQSNSLKNIILTEPSIIPNHLLGQLISPESNSSKLQILWTITCSFHPSHLVFEPESSKLFICSHRGYISVYNCISSNISLMDTFYLQFNETLQPIIIKSLAASSFSLIVILNSSIDSILQLYSHNGLLLRSISFLNQYISQIRYDKNSLWYLELISSSLFFFPFQLNTKINEQTRFISFKQQSFHPFRFAINQTFVAFMDRASTGIILLFDKQTKSFFKQIKSPFIEIEPCDIELTDQILIYRFPHLILFSYLDNEEYIEKIPTNKNICITIGKPNIEVLVSTFTDDNNICIIQCYVK